MTHDYFFWLFFWSVKAVVLLFTGYVFIEMRKR